MMKYLLGLLILISAGNSVFAQEIDWIEKSDEELAIQFYQDGEYEKARDIFEDLLKRGQNRHLSDYYFNCLIKLEDYGAAEKFLKKEIKGGNNRHVFMVELGYVYELMDDEKNSEKTYEEVIDELPNNEITVQAVASAFERRRHDDYAIEAYEKGRELSSIPGVFAKQLAELYMTKGNIDRMVDEYMIYANLTPNVKEEVKGAFASVIEDDKNYEVVKNNLLKRVQDHPEISLYADMLSYIFVSKKEFYAAFVQLRALDKRNEENGKRLFNLAYICVQNKEYKVAESCYEYILGIQPRSPFFYQAKLGAINMKYTRVTETGDYTQEELKQIETDYQAFVNDPSMPFGEKYKGYLRLAEIQALYLGDLEKAINNLKDLKDQVRIPNTVRGEIKLDLADYMLMRGDIWDAKLLYWQVEKDFVDHPLGHRAKYMKGKVSFYTGEFELAKAVLDVLKGSTSELIANDALNLSMLIQDNLGLDTTTTPMELFAKADKYLFMNQLDESEKTLDTILEFFSPHSLDDEVYLTKGDIMVKRRNYEEAQKLYAKVYTSYDYDLLADDALYKAANLYQYRMDNKLEAYKLLEKLVLDHSSSVFTVDARARYIVLKAELLKSGELEEEKIDLDTGFNGP